MTYDEKHNPVVPPEIRHPKEVLSEHDFYVTFDGRYDIIALELITEWLRNQSPVNPVAILFSYLPETDDEPAMLEASLVLGAPVDIG
jgi:hypothetical protein